MLSAKWHWQSLGNLLLLLGGVGALAFGDLPSALAITCVFTNPIINFGQDPSVIFQDGYYYLVQSNAGQITVAKSATITGLGTAATVPVFRPPPGQVYSYDMWAPELFYHEGQWYIYVAATSAPGANPTHRMYVLQADTTDPQGTWTMRGQLTDPTDKWAIDGTVFEYEGQLYTVWSGWPGDEGDFPQNLYIARMSDPLTIDGERVLLSEPDQPWERTVAALQEGPEAFIHDGQLSIVYSADASWTRSYKLGLLKLVGDDPMDPKNWEKMGPVFSENNGEDGAVYGPGHNSTPVQSPDGSESWLLYHAKTLAEDGWGDRAIFAQRFTWSADGTPHFGQPVPPGAAQKLPAGEPCGLVATYDQILATATDAPLDADGSIVLEAQFVEGGTSWLNTLGSFSVAASVQLAQTGAPMAMISQDGGISSNFALIYTGESFAMTLYAPFGDRSVSADADLIPEAGVWYDLIGIYDYGEGEVRLYINGDLVAQEAVDLEPWSAQGQTIIGGARQSTQRVWLFSGTIRDIRLYAGALDEDEIVELP